MLQPGCEQLRLQVLRDVGVEPDGDEDSRLVNCARPGLRSAGTVNVFALFPGWPAGKTVSLQNFITEWLVDWLQVPPAPEPYPIP